MIVLKAATLCMWVILCANLAIAQSLLQKATTVALPAVNPYAYDEAARRAGEKLFRRECLGCHGPGGIGSGRRRTPPLASPRVRAANPGALFWVLKNGSSTHRMPSFSHLPEEQRWQLITYLKTLR